MKPILATLIVGLLCVTPAEAKNKAKDVTGCVQARQNGYELLSVGKKGKTHEYSLVGKHDFRNDVGHRVRVSGVKGGQTITVRSVQNISASCR